MPDVGCPEPGIEDAAASLIEPAVAALHVADGSLLDDAASFAEDLTPLAKVERSREGERLFFLFSPAGGGFPNLCRELRETVRETYWSTAGSVTSALRRTILVANRYLFEHNLNVERSKRCYGGLACAVLRGSDLFLLQAGPVWACVLRGEKLRCFPQGEKLAHMGIGPIADVRLNHVFAGPGETLLLAPYTLLRDATEESLHSVLSLGNVNEVAAGLRQIGGDEFAALVARWESAAEKRTAPVDSLPRTKHSEGPSLPATKQAHRSRATRTTDREHPMAKPHISERERRAAAAALARERRAFFGKIRRRLGGGLRSIWYGLRTGLGGVWRYVSGGLGFLWHGFAAAGAGVLALGKWLIGAVALTIRSTLPGAKPVSQRRVHPHPPPEENRTIMTAVAVAIPIIIVAVVLLAYRQFAAESRLQGIINRAEEQIALAQAAEPNSEEARVHWEMAMEQLEAAAAVAPENTSTQTLRAQVQDSLDEFDDIQRLTLTRLESLGSSNTERRLVLTDQTLFVLDAAEGWVSGIAPDQVADTENEDEGGQGQPALVRTGQDVEGSDVGGLVDCAWLEAEGGRRSSALLVLERAGQLISYDPAWRSEDGAPQLTRVELATPPPGTPVAVGSYEGQFYVLDASADSAGQIWRYRPQGNAYSVEPERYFATPPDQSLNGALDMAIDGHIYVLYQNGGIAKFLGGEPQPFEIRGIPKGLGEVTGFAVDPQGDGTVYIADRGNARIVVVGPDGQFRTQLRARGALGALEALAVSQAEGRLYLLDGGVLYTAPLP
jgi:hypothetical protein